MPGPSQRWRLRLLHAAQAGPGTSGGRWLPVCHAENLAAISGQMKDF